VRVEGLEPPRTRRQILSLVRLPIPPHPHFVWWRELDSNQRRRCQQIYSLPPLATRESLHYGAGDGTRTRNLLITSQLLCQLSYTSILNLATRKGLEPSTSSVTGWHSNQLNYRAIFFGGINRARTCDPLLVRQVLSQLSYDPKMVTHRGLEPLLPP
jgi:hypothetical protein